MVINKAGFELLATDVRAAGRSEEKNRFILLSVSSLVAH
jgi:hypothetical protein